MYKSYEVFCEFPIAMEISLNQDESYNKIKKIFQKWGKDKIVFTMNKTKYRQIMISINNKEEKLQKLMELLEEKEDKNSKHNNSEHNNSEYRQFKLNEDIISELIIKLLLHGKLTEFIDNSNTEVKDNSQKFEIFCKDILKNIFIEKTKSDYNTLDESRDCGDENNESSGLYEEQNFNQEDDINNSLFFDNEEQAESDNYIEDQNNEEERIKEQTESDNYIGDQNNEEERIKEQDYSTTNDLYQFKDKDIKEEIIEKINNFVIENIEKAENKQIKQIFLLSYFIFNKFADRNSNKKPSKVDNILKDNILQKKLSGLSQEEKKAEIKSFLDPMKFWDYFEIIFNQDIKKTDYHSILYQLVSNPKIVKKKDNDNNEYIAEKITTDQYTKMKEFREKIFKFIDFCKEQAKKQLDIKTILAEYLSNKLKNIDKNIEKEHFKNTQEYYEEIKESSNEKLLDDFIEKIKPQFLCYQKTTRKNDVSIKNSIIKKLEKDNIKPCGYKIFNEENIYLYAQNKIQNTNNDLIKEHLKICEKCRSFYELIRAGITYRSDRDNEIFYILKNPYEVCDEYLREEDYLKNIKVDYYYKEFTKNPCNTNFNYLILSLINNNEINEAKKLVDDGLKVYKGEKGFIRMTQRNLENIKK